MKALLVALAVLGSVGVANAYPLYKGVKYPVCSNAGDQTSRPVFKTLKNGRVVVVGYECVQDNRGGGGGARF